MKEHALKNQRSHQIKFISSSIALIMMSLIGFILCIVLKKESFWFSLMLIFSLCLLFNANYCIITAIKYANIITNIRNTNYPKDFCYNVTIRLNTLNDIYLAANAENLCIRYFEDEDRPGIECKYTLDGKEYNYFVTIANAKNLFDCPFLEYL